MFYTASRTFYKTYKLADILLAATKHSSCSRLSEPFLRIRAPTNTLKNEKNKCKVLSTRLAKITSYACDECSTCRKLYCKQALHMLKSENPEKLKNLPKNYILLEFLNEHSKRKSSDTQKLLPGTMLVLSSPGRLRHWIIENNFS